MTEEHGTQPGVSAQPSRVRWPAGPLYFDLTGSEGSFAWVRYRVWAADWYVAALRDVAGPERNYDRLVGVEMAVDGVLNNLSSSFDAGTALLIRTVERALEVPADKRLEVRQYKWSKARSLLHQFVEDDQRRPASDVVSQVVADVDAALKGQGDPSPTGWLAQLRRLRNQVSHQDTLSRLHEIGGTSAISALSGDDAFEYLARSCDSAHELTEQMVSVAARLGAPDALTAWDRPWWFSPSC